MERLWQRGGIAPRSHYVIVDELPVHYVAAGQGEAVVLLHGGGGGCAKWYGTIGPLAQHFRVLAPDLPGFGLSARPRLEQGGRDFLLSWLSSFMPAAGIDRASLVGSSFGGLLALSFALRYPHRLTRLVLMDAMGLGREMPLRFRLLGVPLLGWLLTIPSRRVTSSLFRSLLVHQPRLSDAGLITDYLYQVSASPGFHSAFSKGAREFTALGGQKLIFSDEQLRSVAVPTLALWGEQDRFFPPSHARRVASLIPGARLRFIAGAGHVPNWDSPETVNAALLDFLLSKGKEREQITLKGRKTE